MNSFRFCLASLTLALFAASAATAQSWAYPDWPDYDSTLYIGCDIAGNVKVAMEELTIDYHWGYEKFLTTWLAEYYNPGGDLGAETHREFIDSAYSRGFKIIIGASELRTLVDNGAVIENYPGGNSWAMDSNGLRVPPLSWDNATISRSALDDRKVFFTLNATTDSGTQMIAARPCYSIQAMRLGDQWLFDAIGSADYSRDVRVSVKLFTDETDSVFQFGLADADTLAYVVLLRRYVGHGQSTSSYRWDIWERFDTIAVTKLGYLNGDFDDVNGFSEVGTYYTLDSLASSLRRPDPVDPNGELWFGWTTPEEDSVLIRRFDTLQLNPEIIDTVYTMTSGEYRDSAFALLDSLHADRFVRAGIVEASDIDLEVFTTGRVPIRLLRTKVNMRFYDQLIAGEADGMVAGVVDTIVAHPVLDSVTWRISITNELKEFWEPRAYGYVASTLQREIAAHGRSWQLHANPYQNLAGIRALSGDLDSLDTRIFHALVPQPYSESIPIAEMYADPMKMDSVAENVFFEDMIHLNTMSDYEAYTMKTAPYALFLDQLKNNVFSGSWAYAVDVARFRYRHFAPSFPVLPSVQAQGFVRWNPIAQKFEKNFALPPPEYAKRGIWYALACGADGIHLADIVFSGENLGFLYERTGDHSADTLEYGSVQWFNPATNLKTPQMWLGIPSRFDTIQNTLRSVRKIDTVIGWKNLIYDQEQLTVNDPNQWFNTLPLVDTITARHAKRYSLDGGGGFVDSAATDPKDSTYFEVTHFSSGPGDTTVSDHGNCHYFLILNKRIWPLDTRIYDTINGVPRVRTPLGYIDARKPIVRFASPDALRPDTAVIEGILSGFRDTVLFGEMAELSWLKPGSAELYRVTVLPAGISEHSTAYNNSVHSENPSTDQQMLDQVVVYERDSVVYMRTVDPLGSWSRELMISDPADTAIVNGKRTASNFFPAVALLRDGTARARFVWERDSLGYRSVVTAYIDSAAGVSRSTIDSVHLGEYTVVRHRASVADSLIGPPALTPSIVAVRPTDTTAGFILSWAHHEQGISLLALRPAPIDDTLRVTDSVGVYGIRYTGSGSPGNVGQYPTLATADRREWVDFLTSTISGPDNADSTGGTHPAYPTSATWSRIHLTHLAWQQGDGVDGDDEQIYYSRVGSVFPYNTSIRPTIVIVWSIEHVTKRIQACSFEHPSIAADSVRVGVAFEIYGQNFTHRHIGLRFRDTAAINPVTGLPLRDWETSVYGFGRVLRLGVRFFGSDRSVRPSLTHFPAMDSAALAADPHGGLTWFWTNSPDGRKYPQYLYRYGWFEPREIGDGAHPSLTLVPLRRFGAFENTSILHRGPNATRAVGENDEGQNVWYYTGHLLNTAGNPLPALFNTGGGGNIIGNATVTEPGIWADCDDLHGRKPSYDIDIVFTHDGVTHPPDDRHGPGDPTQISTTPGLPPTFFRKPGNGATVIDDLGDATAIVRTSLFIANDQPVMILRGASAADSTAEWLNTFADDLERGCKADIWSVVELVRASDSVVLWRGDTISARGLDTNDIDSVTHEVSVPVGSYADSGEIVFIQVRPFASSSVVYEVGGGFAFHAEQIGGGAPKAARGREAETGAALLQLSLVPNPVHDGRTTLHVGTELVGRIEIDVWNINGQRVGMLPAIDADRAGTYSVELDLEGVRPGSYLVRAYAVEAERSVTVRLTVVE